MAATSSSVGFASAVTSKVVSVIRAPSLRSGPPLLRDEQVSPSGRARRSGRAISVSSSVGTTATRIGPPPTTTPSSGTSAVLRSGSISRPQVAEGSQTSDGDLRRSRRSRGEDDGVNTGHGGEVGADVLTDPVRHEAESRESRPRHRARHGRAPRHVGVTGQSEKTAAPLEERARPRQWSSRLRVLEEHRPPRRRSRRARVPIISPDKGVKPIEVSTLRPPSTAVIDAPLPRWHTMRLISVRARRGAPPSPGDVPTTSRGTRTGASVLGREVLRDRERVRLPRQVAWKAVSKTATCGTADRAPSSPGCTRGRRGCAGARATECARCGPGRRRRP